MDSINADRYSLMQLKAWCTAVGINASGAKASLAARLGELSAEARGLCPCDKWGSHIEDNVEGNAEDNVEDNVENSDQDNGENVQQRQGDTVVEVTNDDGAVCVQNVLAHVCSGTFGDRLTENSSNDAREKNGMSNVANGTVEDNIKITLLQKEIELLKLQKAQLEKENTNISKVATEGVTFETLKDIIPVYDGGDGFKAWHNQLLHLREVVQINDAVLGVVIHTKLKGAALAWYNSKPTFPKKVDELLREMESIFAAGESKLDRRRRFEKRMWSSEESFANYFNDKCLLGGELNLGDEELADYLIEGIPDRQLRNQARLQNFTSANDVVRAFRSISLPEHTAPKQRTDERMRCYNCNCSGHYAKDCRKPKREAGSCFACGQLGHYAAECKQHK